MTTQITLIAAMGRNRVIGNEGDLPWRLPNDLAHFKRHTLDKPILMGRLTYDSIGRPLPKRRNIVLTRNPSFRRDNVEVIHEVSAVDTLVMEPNELMVIGGAQIYRLFLPRATRLLLTIVDSETAGDAYFPEFDNSIWSAASIEAHNADDKHKVGYTFYDLRRDDQGDPLPSDFPERLPSCA